MTTLSLTAPQKSQDIETEAEISTRLSIHERLVRLVKDPSSAIEDIKHLGLLLTQMIKAFSTRVKMTTHERQLALAEGRLEVRREAMALQRAKVEVAHVTEANPSSLIEKIVPKTKARAKKVGQISSEPVEPEPEPSDRVVEDASPAPVAKEYPTAELLAMEWDLRSVFDFGDLRAFEFCTGSQMIRFPDRTRHPEPAVANYPIGFNPPPDFVQRTDEFVVLPHILPSGFAPKAEGKSKADSKPKAARRQRAEPRLKDGVIDWPSFVRSLSDGTWPFNTILPATWQYGDPIPGGTAADHEDNP